MKIKHLLVAALALNLFCVPGIKINANENPIPTIINATNNGIKNDLA